mmetsp:Transcript_23347/g.55632  ORF Transcript_23347/g.55632 Transcript_23347/m.55632 type:complete len:195 (+) Transcript_23347:154-738(+)
MAAKVAVFVFMCMPALAAAAAVAAQTPDLGVSQFHLPRDVVQSEGDPYSGHIMPQDHVINKPVYPPMNEKLYKGNIARTLSQEEGKLSLHPGTWLKLEPDDIPNLELEPIGYSRQWLGEERMGGGWSSAANPLSVDKKRFVEDLQKMANGPAVSRAGSRTTSPEPEGEEGEISMQTHCIRTDSDGNVHVMPKKR